MKDPATWLSSPRGGDVAGMVFHLDRGARYTGEGRSSPVRQAQGLPVGRAHRLWPGRRRGGEFLGEPQARVRLALSLRHPGRGAQGDHRQATEDLSLNDGDRPYTTRWDLALVCPEPLPRVRAWHRASHREGAKERRGFPVKHLQRRAMSPRAAASYSMWPTKGGVNAQFPKPQRVQRVLEVMNPVVSDRAPRMIPPGGATSEPKSGQGEDPASQSRALTPDGGGALAEPSAPGALGAASVVVSPLAAGSAPADSPPLRVLHAPPARVSKAWARD